MLFNCLNRFREIVRKIMKFLASSAKQDFWCQLTVISECARPPVKLSRWVENYPQKEPSFLGSGKAFNRMHFETEEEKARDKSGQCETMQEMQSTLGWRWGLLEGDQRQFRHLRSGLWQCNHLWLNLGGPDLKPAQKLWKWERNSSRPIYLRRCK